MNLLLSLLMSLGFLSPMAPGDIYRCRDAQGVVRFQDKACAGQASEQLAKGGGDTAATQLELQRWLRARNPARSTRSAMPPVPAASRSGLPFVSGPVSEAQIASCSERFLHCANGNAAAMDLCVDRLPRCSTRGHHACCPQACITRYQALRRDGNKLATSVKLALFDPQAPHCAVAR